jgi:hypothetical protein
MTDARALAKAAGAAQRLAAPLAALARLTEPLPLTIQVQANAVLEELDLLRHYLREALLADAIHRSGPPSTGGVAGGARGGDPTA